MKIIMHNSTIISKVKVTKALTLGSCLWKFEVLKSTFYNSKVTGLELFFSPDSEGSLIRLTQIVKKLHQEKDLCICKLY